MKKRGSGILFHITSLPSSFGIGDLGPWAYTFVDFLAEAKQAYWQILPFNPTAPAFGNSPYNSYSAFACNPLLLSPELMVREGLLAEEDIIPDKRLRSKRVDYNSVVAFKRKLFQTAFQRFKESKDKSDYEKFCKENTSWLDDLALFLALKEHFQKRVWSDWPLDVRDRREEALEAMRKALHEDMERERFLQYVFITQWSALRSYCQEKGIQIIGDIPVYVNYDSVDLWTHPELFKLDQKKRPYAVAGVPPGNFSATGQLWGNPLYRWDILKEREYDWWVQRVDHNLRLFDIVRIDHFRGFVGYWEIPATENNAVNGEWKEAPAEDFFRVLTEKNPHLPLIAEDLGIITPDVREVMEHFAFPGMRVLLFAFGEDDPMHPYLPHTYEENCVVYTGTHDNNTVRGWFKREAKPAEKKRVFRYIGRKVSKKDIHWEFIRLAMQSVAKTAIIPMQDVLGLGEEARMNLPATGKGNWEWRLLPEQITSQLAKKISDMTETYGRACSSFSSRKN
ncbi:MAG: 4-alpha-glucanotransferase [Candidatus Aminicenantes bacterium]|nr:4-alpha-glucanotransferase [Candidatus Aminicenantes bacterium]MDH5705934.1 4-alpha-glucanotransferase [Candidatus Aminicenantes bacterium]